MFIERNTNLEEILFEVEQHPIFLEAKNQSQANLFDAQSQLKFSKIPKFRAITNAKTDYVFSVVADGYKLISNKEAIELGKQCFKSIFNNIGGDKMEVFHLTYPKTKSFCHIDFVHQEGGFEPFEGDKWTPFLRITNSYNRTKLLRFDLGFCRWICTNGMIFGEKSITFKYAHTHGDVAKTAVFNANVGELKTLEAEFIEKLHNLQRYYVPEKFMLPLVCRTFGIKATPEDLARPKRSLQLHAFKNHVNNLTKQYFENLGQNGYAALNVLTDFASRPATFISPEAMVDQFQKRSGKWAEEFITEIKNDKFKFENYLGDFIGIAQIVNNLNESQEKSE